MGGIWDERGLWSLKVDKRGGVHPSSNSWAEGGTYGKDRWASRRGSQRPGGAQHCEVRGLTFKRDSPVLPPGPSAS